MKVQHWTLLKKLISPKGQIILKVKTNSFVRFLGEFEDTKSLFEIIWPLAASKKVDDCLLIFMAFLDYINFIIVFEKNIYRDLTLWAWWCGLMITSELLLFKLAMRLDSHGNQLLNDRDKLRDNLEEKEDKISWNIFWRCNLHFKSQIKATLK